ncbi:hypothetical protein B0H13DRAFT_2321712 [Mycena leptocephala]|nr:hypothetical protein B0H13DRAFT_2321712 [Mycena leptocephala]
MICLTGFSGDPGNWGDLSFLENFTEGDFQAQREALENYAEINRIIKQEEISAPPDFFKDVPSLKTPETEQKLPEPTESIDSPRDNEVSGQIKDEIIAELMRQLDELRQEQNQNKDDEPNSAKPAKSAQQTVQQNIADLMHRGKPVQKFSHSIRERMRCPGHRYAYVQCPHSRFLHIGYNIFEMGDIIAIEKSLNIKEHNSLSPCRSCEIKAVRNVTGGEKIYYVPLTHPDGRSRDTENLPLRPPEKLAAVIQKFDEISATFENPKTIAEAKDSEG